MARPAAAPEPLAPAAGDTFLADLAARLTAGGDLPSLLQRFLAPLLRLAGAQGGTVRVLQDDERLHLSGWLGPAAALCGGGPAVDRHCSHCGEAADGTARVWAHELGACRAGNDSTLPTPARRLLALPLRHQGQVLGVCTLFFAGTTQPADDVLGLLDAVGELLGLALAHARQQAQQQQSSLQRQRLMLAADVHDGVAQSLSFVKMRLPLLQDAMHAGDLARAQQYLDELHQAAGQAQASLRGMLSQMRETVDPLGLAHALEAGALAFGRSCATELTVDNRLPALALSAAQQSQVVHLVQEALTNIARHAAARHAWLHVRTATPGWIEVLIDDDGSGLAPAAGGGHHLGLAIMQDRAHQIGGTLSVGPRPGGGTRVRLLFPTAAPAGLRTVAAEAG